MPERDIFFLSYIDRSIKGEAFTALEKVGESLDDRFVCKYMGRDQLENLEEGNFVQFSEDNLLEKANTHKIAKGEFYKNNVYRASFWQEKTVIRKMLK